MKKLDSINHIAIIGTGMIGIGMAALFTGNGYKTTLYAMNEDLAADGLKRYRACFGDLTAMGLVTEEEAKACEKLVGFTLDYDGISDADFIFECVLEDLDVKHAVYTEIEKICKNFKAIVSSSSAIPPDDIASVMRQKEKMAVAHPYNPPHLVPCVEVVKGEHTCDETVKLVCDLLESCGRAPVIMNKSAPGFIANRLQQALYREAAFMVEEGIASPQDIDKALAASFIPRYTSIGLFEHYDYAGLDLIINIHKTVYPTLCNASEPQKLITDAAERGDLGFKTGKGVLDWSGVDIDDFRRRAAEPYYKFFNWRLPKGKSCIMQRDRVETYFHNGGLNCAESTMKLLLEEYGLDKISDAVRKSMTGFGGGMQRKYTCGAVIAGVAAIGIYRGRTEASESRERSAAAVRVFLERFEVLNGSLLCSELSCGYAPKSDEMYRHCTEFVLCAARLARELI